MEDEPGRSAGTRADDGDATRGAGARDDEPRGASALSSFGHGEEPYSPFADDDTRGGFGGGGEELRDEGAILERE